MFSDRTPASVLPSEVVSAVGVHIHAPLRGLLSERALVQIVEFVEGGSYRRVAVQMPDEWLPYAVATCQTITERLHSRRLSEPTASLFVLADSTFGSCCPDEVTAQHYMSDCIVHFGISCMSRSCRLPVHYVHDTGRSKTASISHVQPNLVSAVEYFGRAATAAKKRVEVVMIPTPAAAEYSGRLLETQMGNHDASVTITVAQFGQQETSATDADFQWRVNGARFKPIDRTLHDAQCFILVAPRHQNDAPHPQGGVLTITVDSTSPSGNATHAMYPQLAALHMIQNYNTISSTSCDDPAEWESSCRSVLVASIVDEENIGSCPSSPLLVDQYHSSRIGRMVQVRQRQRSHHIEVIRASESIGIIVASLAIRGYYETTFALRDVIRSVGKKRCYVLYIGHINEFKVANFVDTVDCFCIIACPNSRVAHFPSKADNFMKPMVEPSEIVEALVASNTSAMPCCYTTDFTSSLPLLEQALRDVANSKLSEASGDARRPQQDDDGVRGELVCRPSASSQTVATTAAAGALLRLAEKSYLGLEPRVGQTPVQAVLTQGKSGIARGYETEQS